MMKQPQQDQDDIHVETDDVAPGSDAPTTPLRRRRRIFIIVFLTVCALVGIIALLVWLIYRPSTIQVSVIAATLSRFSVNSTASPPALSFNLTAGLIITNPNRRVAVYYDLLRAEGVYLGERFDRIALPISFQAANRADVVRAVLAGTSAVGDGDQTAAKVFYPVDLWLDGVVRYRGGLMMTSASTLSVKCPLVLQLMVPSGTVECTVNL